jgi:hypothetical protein
MDAVTFCVAQDLFDLAHSISETTAEAEGNIFEFHVTLLELLGKKAVDLLDPEKQEVAIHENKVSFTVLDPNGRY